MCVSGICLDSPKAPVSNCPFGDDLISNGTYDLILPGANAKCNDAFSYMDAQSLSPTAYCLFEGEQKCCISCQSIFFNLTFQNKLE